MTQKVYPDVGDVDVFVRPCPRCGKGRRLTFDPVPNPTEHFAAWSKCPATWQPISLAEVKGKKEEQ